MRLPKIFVTRRIPEIGLRHLRDHADVTVWDDALPPSRTELLENICGCAGILSLLSDRIDAEVMDHAGAGLKGIANYAVGFNNIDLPAATERGIAVGNTPDVLTDATADMAITLMLAASRHLLDSSKQVAAGDWKTWEPQGFIGVDLTGRTLGVIGMGRIGMAVARRLRGGWGMKIRYTSRTPKPDADRELEACQQSLDDLLRESDFISIHCPLTPETQNLISRKEFNIMKSNAVLVNTARGEVIDQDALVEALESEKIFAAGLDVTAPEPLPPTHPLVTAPRCTIAPHIGSATHDSRNGMAVMAAENLIAAINDQPMPYPVHIL